jgi:predicted lactoylglutathione lyase
MATKIFLNLPAHDLNKFIKFFGEPGFTFNTRFTDETAACMIVSEDIFVMLLTRDKFKTFTPVGRSVNRLTSVDREPDCGIR